MIDPYLLFDKLADGICVSDKDGGVLYVNPAARRMLDVPKGLPETPNVCSLLCGRLFSSGCEPCAKHCVLKEPAGDAQAATFQGRHGPHATFEWRDLKVDRLQHWAHLRVRCLKAPGRLLCLGEEDRHFTLIEDASKELEQSKLKEDWRRMAAHDLRSPLTNVLGTLRLIQEAPLGVPLSPEQNDLVAIGIRSCQRVTELLDLFLDISKFDERVMPVDKKPVCLLALALKAVEEQSVLAGAKRISIGVAIADGVKALGDPQLLGRVLQNLLDNAIKFSPEATRVSVSAALDGKGTATLSVKDEGPGIAAQDMPFLFDRFYHAQARGEGRIQGNGLGLAFCLQAMKAMGGEIDVRSTPALGSEFILKLPAAI